jgi:amphi-Trp domain-containing protein
MNGKPERDIESTYTNAEFVAKLRRLADSIESGRRFEIQIGGERIYVPASAAFSVEHERSEEDEEIEFQIKWSLERDGGGGAAR